MRWTNRIHDARATEADTTDRVRPEPGILELARAAGIALSAVTVCFPMLFAARPKTPLRVLCIAAFEFLARLGGSTVGGKNRLAIAHACDFASLRDGYYDHRRLDVAEYRSLRGELRRMAPESATSLYIRRLRQAERSRPTLSGSNPGMVDAVIAYRTAVLDVSLRWLQRISGLTIESLRFQVLLSLAGLTQLADDLLDWKDDQLTGNPSYVTALLVDRPRSDIAIPLRAEADVLLHRMVGAARQDAGAVPLAVAGALTWTFVITLTKLRFPG